jgi:hypothetical protein
MANAWVPLDPRQQEILHRLRLVGAAPATYFIDACRLMEKDLELDSKTHLVSHLLRELDGALRGVLRPMVPQEDWPEKVDNAHASQIALLCDALRVPDEDDLRAQWKIYATEELASRAHRRGLATTRPLDRDFEDLWDRGQAVLSALTLRIEASYGEALPRIEALASGAPDMTAFRDSMLHSTVALDRFFELAGVDWLEPLREEQYFDSPPPLTPNDEGNFEYPRWPQGRFLVRVAAQAPRSVIEIGRALNTDNPEAHESIVTAACTMSASEAAELTGTIEAWLQTPIQWSLPLKARDLVVHLVDGGAVDDGWSLMRGLVTSPEVGRSDNVAGEYLAWLVPEIFPAAAIPGLKIIVDFLAEQANSDKPGASTYSYVWRPSIASERMRDDRDGLVTSIRDAAELLTSEQSDTAAITSALEAPGLQICQRLALDFLSRHPRDGLANERLLDRELLEDVGCRREYIALAAAAFADLENDEQEQLLSWIGEARQYEGKPERQRYWQLQMLSALDGLLPEAWDARREELASELGPLPAEPPEPVRAGYVGSLSPVPADEMGALDIEALVDFLRTWEPPEDGWEAPSREGLAQVLRDVVTADPGPYAVNARSFVDLDPTYGRALFAGLKSALEEGRPFEWQQVLELAHEITKHPREVEPQGLGHSDRDPDWSWSWRESLELIVHGLYGDRVRINDELRDLLWKVIEFHVESPDPKTAPELEESRDPEILALNSVRCRAVQAAIGLTRLDRESEPDEGLKPELGMLLDRLLDPEVEPSAAVRSVFGGYFVTLLINAEDWARANVGVIFSLEGERRLWRAAWESYVQRSQGHPTLLELLEPQYRQALEEMTAAKAEEQLNDPDEALVAHLMSYYLSGTIDFEDADGLMSRFYTVASLERRERAITVIGTSLEAITPLNQDVEARLRKLVERRLEDVRNGADPSELQGFAWWFAAGEFEAEWSLAYLRRLLDAGGTVHPDHMVAEQLAKLSRANPLEAVEILQLLVEGAARDWFVIGARDSIEAILRGALADDGNAKARARDLINVIVARGNLDFIKLLPDQ